MAAGPHLTPDGYGAVTVGMSQADALKALGEGWVYEAAYAVADGDGFDCGHITSGSANAPVAYMVQDAKVVRIEAATPEAKTAAGIHIGSTEADVRRAYGAELRTSPHAYLGLPALYMDLWVAHAPQPGQAASHPDARGLRFETNIDGKVESIFGGGDAIQLIEGCS